MLFNKENNFLKLYNILSLMRINKPIGFFLLLWPTLWSLWLSNRKTPDICTLIIFIVGTCLMRSFGCVINDYVDRDIDCYIERTSNRPLSCGVVSIFEVLILLFVFLCILFVFTIIIDFDMQTIFLLLIALILTCMYPYTKRCISFPQCFLGITFGCSILIVFSFLGVSLCNILPWLLFLVNVIWTLIYDTEYAMVDRDDDILFNINSSAVFFGKYEKIFIGVLQIVMLLLLILVGIITKLSIFFYIVLICVAILFFWQQILIMHRDKTKCFQAFLSNNYVGMLIFFGIVSGLSVYY